MIVDYAWSKPGGAALKAAGVTGVLRYLSHDSTKTLQRPEADDLTAHGISMAVVFEDMANRAADGYSAGMNDAAVAMQMLGGQRTGYSNLEMPNSRPIYFACDFDAQWPAVAPYFAGASSVLGQHRVGVYGGRAVIEGAANSGYSWLWQAYAWSSVPQLGWHPKALLHQELNTRTINGVDCDIDTATVADWGQWFPGEEIVTEQDKQDIINGVVNAIKSPAVRDALANADMWWWDHILNGTTTASMSPAQVSLIQDINAKLEQLIATPKP